MLPPLVCGQRYMRAMLYSRGRAHDWNGVEALVQWKVRLQRLLVRV